MPPLLTLTLFENHKKWIIHRQNWRMNPVKLVFYNPFMKHYGNASIMQVRADSLKENCPKNINLHTLILTPPLDGTSFYGDPVQEQSRRRCFPSAAEALALLVRSAGQACPWKPFPGRPALHGRAGNNNSLL